MNIDHELKSWVGLFEPIFLGLKTHKLRVLDRDYKIGDICLLKEYDPLKKEYTGRDVKVKITYITSSKHQECAFSPFALHSATGILSIAKIDNNVLGDEFCHCGDLFTSIDIAGLHCGICNRDKKQIATF